MAEKNTIPKLNPNYRKVKPVWWDDNLKTKRRRRRTAYKGIITPDKRAELL